MLSIHKTIHKMKTSKVLPIFKQWKRNEMYNYRPISLLPQILILENVFAKRLNCFFNKLYCN